MYKVILFNHGQTAANGKVLLDTSSGENPGLTQAVVETKLNEAGSFNYSIIPTHPLYNMTSPLKVYVSVEEDGTEIFYGRILSVQTNPLTKIKSVTCEGALAFLLDCELAKDSDDWESTAANYFKYCINKYNEGIQNDANRLLKIGTINVDGSSETHSYNNGSFTQIQSVMKSQLLNAHDGFFRIRRQNSTGDHYIDWVKQVGASNPQQIAITQNVISQNNTESGEDIFSVMRPVGNDDLTLSDSGGLIPVSQSMIDDYGHIIRTVTFDAKDANTLRTKATEYIEKIKNRLTITGDISFVDFHFLDGSSTKVHVGDVFTNIEGYEGTKLTAESVSRNLLDAGKDKLSIKNDKDLMNSAAASGANSSNATGVKAGRKASSGSAHMHKFYHETQTDASLAAKNLFISAEEKIETRAKLVETYADGIDERLSDEVGKVKINTDNLQKEWTTYKGTEIYKNKEHIDQVCGLYQIEEYTDPATGKTVKRLVVQEGSALYQTYNGVIVGVYDNYNLTGGMMVQKINNESHTTLRGDLVSIEGQTTINDVITINESGQAIFGRTVAVGNSESGFTQINGPKVTANTLAVRENGSLDFTIGHGESASAMSLTGSILGTMIKTFEINGNVLTLTRFNGVVEDFSKATSLSGTWSGSTLTVTASPQNETYQVRFGGSYAANRTNLEVHSAGTISIKIDSVGAKMLAIPVNVQRLTGSQSAPETVYTTTINVAHGGLLTGLEATENKRYNLADDPDHIGYSYVDVNVTPTLSGTWADGALSVTSNPRGNTYKVQFGGSYAANRSNLEVVSGGSAYVTTSGSTKYVAVPVKIQRLTGSQSAPEVVYEKTINPIYTSLLTTMTITANDTYTPGSDFIGFSSVTVAVPSKDVVVSADKGFMDDGVWKENEWSSDNKITVRLFKDGTQVSGGFTIDAGDLVAKNRTSRVAYVNYTESSDDDEPVQQTLSNGAKYKIQSQYKNAAGGWVNGGTFVIKVPKATASVNADEIQTTIAKNNPQVRGSVNGVVGQTLHLLISVSTYTSNNVPCVNVHANTNNEATTASPVIGRISIASSINTAHNNGGKTAWLYKQSSSSWTKVKASATLGEGTYRVRYTNSSGNVANVADALFYVPERGITGLTEVTSHLKDNVHRVLGYGGMEKYEAFFKSRDEYESMGTYYWFRADTGGYSNADYTYYWK